MNLPRKPDYTIQLNMKSIHIWSIVLTLLLILAGGFFTILFYGESRFSFSLLDVLLWGVLYILLIILHEICHLIGFIVWGKCKKEDLLYGVNRELGIAYAGTKKILPVHAMRRALLLPFWITGLLPFAAGIWLNSVLLIIVGASLIGGAAGDFSMYKQLRRVKPDAFVLDHTHKPVLYIFNEKIDSPS
ncbi:DUF3267 domain-containing protein [Domibacillus robiginosus]|uniref:DUF3267 domain-containing protein n=1 Tax=Domibacillus robiginosus TaxID=1071054 RepID=UPI00067C2B14|nr:DUF3267 domain-containing protein [Domibacillus robiginosus]